MIKRNWMLMIGGLALCLASSIYAQNSNSGDIRGTTTDVNGRVIPGVDVTVTNNDTGVVTKYLTNNDGLYDTNSILPGSYTVQFTKGGFESLKQGPIALEVGFITVDGVLKVGSVTEVVEVNSSDAPILKTEDATVETTLSTKELENLPNLDPENGYTYLLKLLPGATSTAGGTSNGGGQGGNTDPAFDQAINGTMPYFSSYLVDGGSIWLPHSANTDQGISEAVSELQVIGTDANATYGGGGAVFNVILKSGANQFHGSAYENFQNDALNSRTYFETTKPTTRYNYFGGAVGGPILKDKMFFYFNFQRLENPSQSFSTASEPTAAMKAGCFDPAIFGKDLTLDARYGNAPLTSGTPADIAQCSTADPGNAANDYVIPTADFDPVAQNIINAGYYANPTPGAGIENNLKFLVPSNGNNTKTVARLDYNITPKNRLDFSIVERWQPIVVDYSGVPNCPVGCENYSADGGNGQLSDVWTFTNNLVNEYRFSFNREADYFAQQSLGQGIPAKIGLQFSTADVLPTITIGGTGGETAINPGTEALFIQNSFVNSDVLTWVKGKNILHFGGELLMEEDNSTPWGGINGASLSFTGQFTTSNPAASETGFADFLLGDVQGWNTNSTPKHYMRAKNPSFFAQDDLKLRPNFTINLGVRVETHGASTEKYNNAGGFDPTLADPLGSSYVSGATTYAINPLGSVWFAGLNGARSASYESKTLVLPRLGFAWEPTGNWVIRGGVGQYSSLWSEDTVGGPMGFGSGSTGSQTTASTTTPVVQLSGTGANLPVLKGAAARNPLSYITPASPQGSGNIPYTPYSLPVQNGWQWTVGVQRRLPGNIVAEAQYVGSHWSNMQFLSDINQLPANKLGQGQAARPYPQFSGIGVGSGGSRTGSYNGVSNYEAAQFMLHKPLQHGLALEAAYTWSSLKDDMDDSGWGESFGNVYYQDAFNPSANYAKSNFNRPNSLKGTVLYNIPLGKGHAYLNSDIGDAVLGGWEASGDYSVESGTPFTVVMNDPTTDGDLGASDGNSEAAWYPNLTGNPNSGGRSIKSWFNQQAYASPAANTFGTNSRNSLVGPDFVLFDFSLAKTWGIPGWESAKFQLRMDGENIFNHPAFQNPSNQLNPNTLAAGTTPDPSVGQIHGTDGNWGRIIMFTGRFSF